MIVYNHESLTKKHSATVCAGPRESKTRSKLQKKGRKSGWTKRIFRFQMLPLDQRNLLIICGQNFIYNNAAGSHCFLGLAHGPAMLTVNPIFRLQKCFEV
ncbi:hypothetical protein YC2023_081171 [Brassica napus]